MSLRVICDDLIDPWWSAAIDHSLVDSVRLRGSSPILHIYRRPPTVSLGYFQPSADIDRDLAESKGIAVLRRMSGGGTIYNDEGQLIYTLVIPERMAPRGSDAALAFACEGVADAVRSLGAEAVVKEPNDVHVSGLKVSGNSQLRSAGTVALQGTMILDGPKDMEVLMKPSSAVGYLSELLGRRVGHEEASRALVHSFSDKLGIGNERSSVTGQENSHAGSLLRKRYGNQEFIWGR